MSLSLSKCKSLFFMIYYEKLSLKKTNFALSKHELSEQVFRHKLRHNDSLLRKPKQ